MLPSNPRYENELMMSNCLCLSIVDANAETTNLKELCLYNAQRSEVVFTCWCTCSYVSPLPHNSNICLIKGWYPWTLIRTEKHYSYLIKMALLTSFSASLGESSSTLRNGFYVNFK